MSYYLEKNKENQKRTISDWVNELSSLLNRTKEEILNKGLSAYDFKSNTELEIIFHDGSKVNFKSAFFIKSEKNDGIAVFTEHCGYFVFSKHGIKEINKITTETFVFEND